MKNKKMIIGILALSIGLSSIAFADSTLKAVTAYINKGLKMTYDGKTFVPKETDGTEIYPLVYNNRTYLPLRAVSEKMGLTIDYTNTDNTICIKTKEYMENLNLNPSPDFPMVVKKPNIYLYPTKKQDTTVKLNFSGDIFVTYPTYSSKISGWDVTAYPDGKIINKADNKEYSYLFWEGKNADIKYDLSEGFIVEGKDTMSFLQETLSKMGLTPKEYNEFIVYWLPQMQGNKYNLIHFAGKEYTDNAKLDITPKPDSMLRVFMAFKPLDKKIEVKAQKINPFIRKGFTVVEWGGSEIR